MFLFIMMHVIIMILTIDKVDPVIDWSRKYSRRARGLSKDKVRRYGQQILEVHYC